MPRDIAVVVVTHNSQRVIEGLLGSLPAALDGLAASVVVVDNGSSDATRNLVANRTDCILVASDNCGYAAGINRGVDASAEASAILVLNPDVRLEPGSVRTMLAAMDRNTGVVVPRITSPDGSLFRSLRHRPTLSNASGLGFLGIRTLSEYVSDASEYERPHVVDWALGAVMLVSWTCHQELGGWDESYFLYSEETDFCLRAREIGLLTRYEPSASAMHIGGDSGSSPRIHSMQIVNRVRLYTRRHSVPAGWVYWLLSVASETSWIVRGHTESRAAVLALLRPSRRPAELQCGKRLLPR